MKRSEHIQHSSVRFAILHGSGSWCPETVSIVTSNTTDYRHHHKYNNKETVGNIAGIIKIWHKDKWENTIGKMVLVDFLDAVLSQTFQFVKKKKKARKNALSVLSAVKWRAINWGSLCMICRF